MATTIFTGGEAVSPSSLKGEKGLVAHREKRWGLIFVSPWLTGLTLLFTLPLVASLVISFTNYELVDQDGVPNKFVGLKNYRRLISDPEVSHGAYITLRFAVVFVPLMIGVPLGLAYLLTSKHLWFRGFFRAMFFIPTMVPFIASVIVWRFYLNPETGWFSKFFKMFGITMPDVVNDPTWIMGSLWMIALWGIGNTIIIYTAALNGVPKDLYEAATIDGASNWRLFRDVTMPMISPIIFYNLVLTFVALGQYFIVPFALSDGTGNPAGATRFYTMYFYKQTFNYFQGGYGAALAWVMFLVVFAVAALIFWSAKFWVHYEYDER